MITIAIEVHCSKLEHVERGVHSTIKRASDANESGCYPIYDNYGHSVGSLQYSKGNADEDTSIEDVIKTVHDHVLNGGHLPENEHQQASDEYHRRARGVVRYICGDPINLTDLERAIAETDRGD